MEQKHTNISPVTSLVLLVVIGGVLIYWTQYQVADKDFDQPSAVPQVTERQEPSDNKEETPALGKAFGSSEKVYMTIEDVFKEFRFKLTFPNGWKVDHSGRKFEHSDTGSMFNMAVLDISEGLKQDSESKLLYREDKILEAERLYFKGLCGETASCGTIVSSRVMTVGYGSGMDFLVRYQGAGIDGDPKGRIDELHRTIRVGDLVYRFWTSEIYESNGKRKTEPQFDSFRKILDTFELSEPNETENNNK